jgi:hypothetical protein
MAKSQAAKMTDTFEAIRPYLERALRDDEFRRDLKDALSAARELYGPLSKGNGVTGGAKALATDKKAQEHLRRAVDDLASAANTLQGAKKKSHKGRKMLILAGIVAGALYNPWTGPQTREKILDMIAGNDDLEPLETYAAPDVAPPVNGEPVEPAGDEPAASTSGKGSKALKSDS